MHPLLSLRSLLHTLKVSAAPTSAPTAPQRNDSCDFEINVGGINTLED
jgi:hypothetical protein